MNPILLRSMKRKKMETLDLASRMPASLFLSWYSKQLTYQPGLSYSTVVLSQRNSGRVSLFLMRTAVSIMRKVDFLWLNSIRSNIYFSLQGDVLWNSKVMSLLDTIEGLGLLNSKWVIFWAMRKPTTLLRGILLRMTTDTQGCSSSREYQSTYLSFSSFSLAILQPRRGRKHSCFPKQWGLCRITYSGLSQSPGMQFSLKLHFHRFIASLPLSWWIFSWGPFCSSEGRERQSCPLLSQKKRLYLLLFHSLSRVTNIPGLNLRSGPWSDTGTQLRCALFEKVSLGIKLSKTSPSCWRIDSLEFSEISSPLATIEFFSSTQPKRTTPPLPLTIPPSPYFSSGSQLLIFFIEGSTIAGVSVMPSFTMLSP